MNSGVVLVPNSKEALNEAAGQREELVRRVGSSSTFERSPRLQAFFLYVCRCALENKPEEVTEQQIGVNVYGRQPGYNPNDDNIVRSQARLLRMKLEHHFANEGKGEPMVITIPKGHYLPVFETRAVESEMSRGMSEQTEGRGLRLRPILVGAAVLLGIMVMWRGYLFLESRASIQPASVVTADSVSQPQPNAENLSSTTQPLALALLEPGEIRIAAGHTGTPYVDMWGHRWEADRYYQGGVPQAGPQHFFPPVADEGMFRNMREAVSASLTVPQTQRQFRYDIPASPGVYELRLYFADPLRRPDVETKEDAQNSRNFQINLNGHPLLVEFDPIADAGSAAIDVRAFKDVSPDSDGKLHLEFIAGWGAPPFVSAVQLTPGIPGRLKPIRISAHRLDFIDGNGTRWSGDNYFIEGRTNTYENLEAEPKLPPLYTVERHGNFSYAIPVPPGSYTVKLHFLESFFTPLVPAAFCHGSGCRVFDVNCNGVILLQDFDIVQAAGGALSPVVREFHGLHPNGQGKLVLSFSPKVNYAEVRAIEIIDEGK